MSSENGICRATLFSFAQKSRRTPASSRVALRMASISALVKRFVKASLMPKLPENRPPDSRLESRFVRPCADCADEGRSCASQRAPVGRKVDRPPAVELPCPADSSSLNMSSTMAMA